MAKESARRQKEIEYVLDNNKKENEKYARDVKHWEKQCADIKKENERLCPFCKGKQTQTCSVSSNSCQDCRGKKKTPNSFFLPFSPFLISFHFFSVYFSHFFFLFNLLFLFSLSLLFFAFLFFCFPFFSLLISFSGTRVKRCSCVAHRHPGMANRTKDYPKEPKQPRLKDMPRFSPANLDISQFLKDY